jgi:hypothetical protein
LQTVTTTTTTTTTTIARGGVAAGAALVAVLSLYAATASAHLLPAGQATLRVAGDSVFSVLSVPTSALHGFDDDGDGLMSLAELDRHGADLRAEIGRRVAVGDDRAPATTVRLDLVLSPEHDAVPDRAAHVIALVHTRLNGAPDEVRVRWDLFGTGLDEQQVTFTASRVVEGGEPPRERATLTPTSAEHVFFAANAAARGQQPPAASAGRGARPVVLVAWIALLAAGVAAAIRARRARSA